MKIILLKDIPKVGRRYEVKDVSDGYASNMLIPRGLAKVATSEAINKIEQMKRADLAEKKVQGELLAKNLEILKDLKITFQEKANEKGHLFASITKEMLAEEILKVARFNIDPESIKLVKPIKETGQYKVSVEAMGESADFVVIIEAKE